MLWTLLLAFLCGFLMDLVWTKCVAAVALKQPLHAANLSVLCYGCVCMSTNLIVDQNWLAVSSFAIGNWVGTYIAIKWWVTK
jgi:hypothetical protein